ncbi:hypothetical protein ACNOYE_25035 [Nannocystaceae bacterium ST9]
MLLFAPTLAPTLASTGCVITISDDFADDGTGYDEQGDSTAETSAGESSSESTDDGDGDGDTTATTGDGDGDTTTTTGDGDGDTTTETTGGGECAPMNAMNGPEECYSPRGWFWNGVTCEQIICTCDGPDCNALFPDEGACLEQYAECQPPPPSCAPQGAVGVGGCEIFLGWKWDGIDCVPLSGCNCEGPDCGNLYADPDQCKDDHAECVGPDCAPDDALPSGDCQLPLGVIWTGDNCLSISGCECIGSDCDNIAIDELTCWDEHALCELGDPCQPDDALGVGLCDAFFGYAWNGEACVGQSGCECVGLDCEFLSFDIDECEAQHAECNGVPPCAGAQDAKGVGLCELFLGWAWNGMACEPLSGCSCEGSDCNNLYAELDICEVENAGCL